VDPFSPSFGELRNHQNHFLKTFWGVLEGQQKSWKLNLLVETSKASKSEKGAIYWQQLYPVTFWAVADKRLGIRSCKRSIWKLEFKICPPEFESTHLAQYAESYSLLKLVLQS